MIRWANGPLRYSNLMTRYAIFSLYLETRPAFFHFRPNFETFIADFSFFYLFWDCDERRDFFRRYIFTSLRKIIIILIWDSQKRVQTQRIHDYSLRNAPILSRPFRWFNLFSIGAETIDQPRFELETGPRKPFIRNGDKMVTVAQRALAKHYDRVSLHQFPGLYQAPISRLKERIRTVHGNISTNLLVSRRCSK